MAKQAKKDKTRQEEPFSFDWVRLELLTGDPKGPTVERSRLVQWRDVDRQMETWDAVFDFDHLAKNDGLIGTNPDTKQPLDRPRYVFELCDPSKPPDNETNWFKHSGEWHRDFDDDAWMYGGYGYGSMFRHDPQEPIGEPDKAIWATAIPEGARRGEA